MDQINNLKNKIIEKLRLDKKIDIDNSEYKSLIPN